MLAAVPEHRNTVFRNLLPALSSRSVGHEFNINQSTVFIKLGVSKEKHIKQSLCINWSTERLRAEAHGNAVLYYSGKWKSVH